MRSIPQEKKYQMRQRTVYSDTFYGVPVGYCKHKLFSVSDKQKHLTLYCDRMLEIQHN